MQQLEWCLSLLISDKTALSSIRYLFVSFPLILTIYFQGKYNKNGILRNYSLVNCSSLNYIHIE